jgi:hypothetical protein
VKKFNPNPRKSKTIGFADTPECWELIKDEAKKSNITPSKWIREAVRYAYSNREVRSKD